MPVLEQLRSAAAEIDQHGVTREVVGSLADAGYFTAGVEAAPAVVRELAELLASASGATWFVAAQHRSPTEAVRATENEALRKEWADALIQGSALGAVAFAHLRRPGPPQVRAVADGSAWRVSGRLDWITSWGLADVLLLMAESDDGSVVQALLPARETPGLQITGPLALAAMSGTATVGAVLDDLRVETGQVLNVCSKSSWLTADAQRIANASPAVFGLLRATLTALQESAHSRGVENAAALVYQWIEQTRDLRSRAYQLVDDVPAHERLDERLDLRARSLVLLQQTAAALIAVQGGRAMLLSADAQRLAREALFMLVQAQSGPLRDLLVALYAGD